MPGDVPPLPHSEPSCVASVPSRPRPPRPARAVPGWSLRPVAVDEARALTQGGAGCCMLTQAGDVSMNPRAAMGTAPCRLVVGAAAQAEIVVDAGVKNIEAATASG